MGDNGAADTRGWYFWPGVIFATLVISVLLSVFGLLYGITNVTPHLFYLPIVLAAYRYPRSGVQFSILVGLVYLVPVWLLIPIEMDQISAAIIRVIFFVLIAGIVSVLSLQLKEHASDVEIRNRHLNIINNVVGISTLSSSVDELIGNFLERVVGHLAVDGGAIFLVIPQKGLEFRNSWGLSGSVAEVMGDAVTGSEPVHEALDGAMVYDTAFTVPGRDLSEPDTFSCGFIPLKTDKTVVGLIILFRKAGTAFSSDEQKLAETVGNEMGIAIHRVRLMEELENANDEANLYLDIMAHDINNANTITIGYTGFLLEMLEGEERNFARKVMSSAQKSVEIIDNVSTIRKLRQKEPQLYAIELDPVIRGEIERAGDIQIAYGGSFGAVMADDLLPEIFTNLIGNSVKFGGEDVEIEISVIEQGDLIGIAVSDNGPGIADEDKPEIFNRFRHGNAKRSGKGLGLYITRMLVERYGGTIRADDRVPGSPEEGACIRLTLRRAEGE